MKQFINLTTGIDHLKDWQTIRFDGFIRLQSSHLEQKHFQRFLEHLDNNILMWLALGEEVWIYDTTSRRTKNDTSRVCWQGIPWIMYCLYRAWFNQETEYELGMHFCFQEKYSKLKRCAKNRLKYYRRFLLTDEVKLRYVCNATEHDGDDEYFLKILKENVLIGEKY